MKHINVDELFNQALAEEVNVGIYQEDGSYEGIYTAVLTSDLVKMANEMPSADVVEVVRCKDCKYALPEGRENVYICTAKTNPNYCWFDEYCSCGERKETDEAQDSDCNYTHRDSNDNSGADN